MAWVSVHQEVDGTKLRRLYKAIGCSKFEALGILNFLWFWGMKNADETGLAESADLDVLSCYLLGCSELPQFPGQKVAQALVDTGWVDLDEKGIRIHDWDVWQEQWYKLQRIKRNDAERKRREYRSKKAHQGEESENKEVPTDSPEESPPEKPPEKPPVPEVEPKAERKRRYAENVRLKPSEHEKLLTEFGEPFTNALIEKLNSYKGQNNKNYKSDYMAIRNWVVDAVKSKNPGLLQMSKATAVSPGTAANPFAEYGDMNG